jgi:hypothetical protein
MRMSAKPESAANGTPTQHQELLSSATEGPSTARSGSSRQSQKNR